MESKPKLKLIAFIFGCGVLMLLSASVINAFGLTLQEELTFLDCTYVVGVGAHEEYFCDRIALYFTGECERGTVSESNCNHIRIYSKIMDSKENTT